MIAEHFEATKPIEIWGGLPIIDYPRMGSPIRQRVAHLFLPDCKTGDIVQFHYSMEVTNDQYYAVEFTGKIILTAEEYPSINGCKLVSDERGYNVSPQVDQNGNVFHGMHHATDDRSGSFVIDSDGDYWIAAVYYAGGSSFTQTSESLRIEPNYGDFTAVRFRQ